MGGRLEGKYAVITGGNSGIGAATARLFVEEAVAGLAILDLDKPDADFQALARSLRTEHGCDVLAIACDVSQPDLVRVAFKTVVERFGRIDILVNSAGVLDHNASVLKTDDELWDRTIAINQSGLFYCCREALLQMESQSQGTIVNVSSVAGISGNSGAAYSSSKHAVVGLTKNIAIQYTGTDIRCNCVCPGPTKTAMTELRDDERGEDGLPKDPRFDREFTRICQRHVDGTVGFLAAEDQAKAILFFASDDAKAITGQWLQVDKGFY
jgi:NAD(P)-dependent dehydrogenase (short-subunit alcohol dehydrogenase family)